MNNTLSKVVMMFRPSQVSTNAGLMDDIDEIALEHMAHLDQAKGPYALK